MGNTTTLTFKTPEALINGLVPILVTLGRSEPEVYIDIFPKDVQWSWKNSELTDKTENVRQDLKIWLPWPDQSNGHSTVAYGDGHTITVTLT